MHTDDFASLYRHYLPILHERAGMYGFRNTEDIQDMVQDFFLKLWAHRNKLNDVQSLDGYFFIVARNHFIGEREKTMTKEKHFRNLAQYFAKQEISASNRGFEYKETERFLQDGTSRLSMQVRRAFELEQDGFTRKEIASRIGICPFTANRHCRVAKKKLKHWFEEEIRT